MTIGEAFATAGRRARLAQALLELTDGILSDAIAPGEIGDRLEEIRKQFLLSPSQASDGPPTPGPNSN